MGPFYQEPDEESEQKWHDTASPWRHSHVQINALDTAAATGDGICQLQNDGSNLAA
jgi:hypothetical protein